MKKFLSFIFALMMCLTAQATGLSDLKFGQAQIADSQWNVQACTQTSTCQIYSKNPGTAYKIPWTSGQLSWAAGDYVAFAATGNSTNPFNAVQYSANGTQKAVMGTGHIVNMGSDYFFFVGNDNNTGQLFSMTQGFNNTSGVTWTGTLNPTVAQVNAYAANGSTTPLAAGQRAAPPPPPPPTNYTTTAGTMPGGYIGRILNNIPGQTQNYSFTYTPGQTGSQYIQLAFRQDPAFWTVTNVTLTAGGSSTNLLQNGNFATGGTITAQTNNGPMDVNTPTYWGVAYQAGIYPGAAGSWSPGQWYDGAVGSFDAIYQGVTLTAGVTYTVTVTVRGDNTSNTNLDGAVQLGVYAAPCGSLTLSPDQCTLPSNSGYTTLATPQEGASAGAPPAAPTVVSTSTSDSVSTSTSVGTTTTTNNSYSFGNQTFTVTGTGTPTTTTTTTTPVTTTYWSDGSTTTSNGSSTTTTSTTWDYTVTGPNTSPASPNVGTNRNSVYITQTNAGASNSITTDQSGHGNYESVSLGGSNNIVRLGQGYTFSTSGVATESVNASNYNLSGVTVSGNFNGIVNSQVGANNSAIVSATGNYNSLLATQTGNNNQVYSTISGNNNSLSFGQNGNGNIAAANLYGNSNVATVTQTGNNHGAVLNLINAGGANNVSVIQTGTGDAYSLQQTCTNPAGCSVSVIRNH
jgi:hypothetical protein